MDRGLDLGEEKSSAFLMEVETTFTTAVHLFHIPSFCICPPHPLTNGDITYVLRILLARRIGVLESMIHQANERYAKYPWMGQHHLIDWLG